MSDRTVSGKRFVSDGYVLLTQRDSLVVRRKEETAGDAFVPIRCAGAYHVNGSRVLVETLAWTLSMGTDIGGSATPIGASANVVGTAIAEKNGHPISWGRYCRSMVPATILVMIISMAMLVIRYC